MGITKPGGLSTSSEYPYLMVHVWDLGDSEFLDFGKMLKVTVGDGDAPLKCATKQDLSNDPAFVLKRKGCFFYRLPREFTTGSHKLGLIFWKASLRNLQLFKD